VTAELAHVAGSAEAPLRARREAVEALSTLRTFAATTALQAATRHRDAGPRALAIAALLQRGDMAWLGPAASILLSHEQGVDPYLVWRLATAIEASVKDPKAIPTLVRLLHAPEVPVRRAAAAALRNTRDPAAIGPLTEALDDSDRDVRYQGVIGLAEITGADSQWAPAYDTFLNNQGRYLTYWRDRAKSRK
jgi:HEAT repeat protein